MKLKKYVFSVSIAFLAAMPVYAEPASPESINILMQKTGAANLSLQVMSQMLPAIQKMIPEAPDKFWVDVMSEASGNEMERMMIPIYQKYLTKEDVDALNNFYDTPVGRKLIRVQPSIVQESMVVGQRWGQSLAREILAKYKSEANKP